MKKIDMLAIATILIAAITHPAIAGLAECGFVVDSKTYYEVCDQIEPSQCGGQSCGWKERGHNLCCEVEYPSVCYQGTYERWADPTTCHLSAGSAQWCYCAW